MPGPPPVGHVAIVCDDPPRTVVARLGQERPDVTAGYGGWEEVERPRRTTVTTWKGQPARRMALALLIDNWLDPTPNGPHSVEDTIRDLERMALPRSGGQPPTVVVSANGGHVPYTDLTWVIEGISWGDALMNAYGNRVRQAATVTLLEFESDDLIQARSRQSPAQRQRAKASKKSGKGKKKNSRDKRKPASRNRRSSRGGGARALTATAASFDGEDLMAIAARELGDARRWREIADLNGIRDPRAVTIGQVLRLP